MKVIALLLVVLLVHSSVFAEEICFPLTDGTRMLQDIEALEVCREAVDAGENLITSCEARANILEYRVIEQDNELKDARKLVDDTRKAGEEAVKIVAGPWYQRILTAGKWIALGIVIGFVGGLSK